jgi:hypothetical protein
MILSEAFLSEIADRKSVDELEEVEIIFQPVARLGGLESCRQLRTLSLISNGLTVISHLEPVGATLTELCLTDQNLTRMEGLDCLPHLRRLCVRACKRRTRQIDSQSMRHPPFVALFSSCIFVLLASDGLRRGGIPPPRQRRRQQRQQRKPGTCIVTASSASRASTAARNWRRCGCAATASPRSTAGCKTWRCCASCGCRTTASSTLGRGHLLSWRR